MFHGHAKVLLVATAAWSLAAPAAIAAPAGPEAAQADDAQAAAPGDIIVTARKRDERLMDVPVAISALSGEKLSRYATNSLISIGEQVPQLVIGESTNQAGGSINLRGIGAGLANPSTEQAVTLNLDGIPISYGNAVRLGQFDLQRVEVLKGPQSLFYGKNSPGGIISLISADPGASFEARLRTGYEFAADQRFAEGMVSGPLTENVGARLVAYYSKEDGWFRNLGVPLAGRTPGASSKSNNAEDFFIRGTLTFRTTDDRFRVKIKVNHGQRDRDGYGPGGVGQPVFCPGGASQVAPITTDCKLDRNYTEVALPASVAALHPDLAGPSHTRSRQFLVSGTADYDLNDTLTLTSVSGFYRLQEHGLGSFTSVNDPRTGASLDLKIKGLSEELRLTSDFDGPLNFMLGGFYQDGDLTVGQAFFTYIAAPALVAATFYDQHTEAYSLFGQARYELSDQLELAVGARQSWEQKSLKGTVANTPTNASPFEILNPRRKYHDFSPEVTLTYKPTTDLTVYAAYREGFTSGGFNTTPGALRTGAAGAFPTLAARDLSFDQMTAKGGELGIKGNLADRQIQFDLVAYRYDYKGLQLSRWDEVAFTQRVQNAGSARIQGVEFSTTVRPDALQGLELRGAVSYNDAKYRDFIGGCYAGQAVAAGCNLLPRNPASPATAGTAANPFNGQDQSGQRLARAPEWALTAGFTYEHEVSADLGGSVTLDTSYTSSYATQTEAHPLARQPGYWQLNGSVSVFGGRDKPWELALIGRNLTNKLYTATGGTLAFTGTGSGTGTTTPADILGISGPPRSVLLQLTLRSSLLGNR
ncbi:TonB-dependent receptor [Novosphingobium album (ex Liu et al. 2023)]|uniref:TonB-dependent receptor n=1 Tax=Novosphingobium album (ex Liu et al. 2023) TaxID=3031130 RepID=A0ABT5WR53_9SPHN|nr:TonB-dependent receptor [Novosphingobium album (ex Liu et al. 2023)]MDE8652211.1 TonB-dependent receptor [Novosphingobium album (ex Liu et al. 2023)]